MQAALRLHHDASLIMTNVQIMSQLVMSFSRTASEVMRAVHDRPEQWILSNRDAGCDVQPTTWLLWAYGDQPALRSSRAPFRPHRVICVWRVRIVSQTVDSENIGTS